MTPAGIPMCPASRIGYGSCVHTDVHTGWHKGSNGAEWPAYEDDPGLDAILTGDTYRLPALEVTR